MYTLICGSQKLRLSNSMHFLNEISQKLDKYNLFDLKKDGYEEIINSIQESDTVVFAFPLYVDAPTSIVLEFLDYIIDNKIKMTNKLVYLVVNCGFRESFQNITAVNIMKNWCSKVKATYMCSLQIGAGEIVGNKKYKFMSKKSRKAIDKFAQIVCKKEKTLDVDTTVDLLNNKMFCYVANISWNKNGKQNNLTEKDIRIKK